MKYSFHDVLSHKRETSHGRARMILEKHRPYPSVETQMLTCVIGETVTVLTSRICQGVRGSFTPPVFVHLTPEDEFVKGCLAPKKQAWRVMEK